MFNVLINFFFNVKLEKIKIYYQLFFDNVRINNFDITIIRIKIVENFYAINLLKSTFEKTLSVIQSIHFNIDCRN